MLAARITGPSQLSIEEVERPALEDDGDVILMVTTAAIGPWDMAAYERGDEGAVPGAQFVGIIVEVGPGVESADIDDLVTCRVAPATGGDQRQPMLGGHAEYVRVPDADARLVRTTPGGEERTVLAGGAVGIGIAAAEKAAAAAGDGSILAWGCDATALSALAWLRRKGAADLPRFAFDHRQGRSTVGRTYGAKRLSLEEVASLAPRVVLFGSPPHGPTARELAPHLPNGATVIVLDPAQDLRSELPAGMEVVTCEWPSLEQVKRATLAVQLREVNLTPLVSHVKPLDEAEEAYRQAAEAPPATQSLLLKP